MSIFDGFFGSGSRDSFRDEDEGFTKNDPARSRNYGSYAERRAREAEMSKNDDKPYVPPTPQQRAYTGPGTAGATVEARDDAARNRGLFAGMVTGERDEIPYAFGPTMYKDPKGFMDTLKNLRPSMMKDLQLGLGSLRGLDGFRDALEGMGHEGLTDSQVQMVFNNFRQASRNTRDRPEAESDGDNNFYGNYDPCPEGYRTDPVTGMCVPVMGVAYDTAPSAPAQYQGNFVGDPFPTIASGGGMTSPVVPSMDYTQPMDYSGPTISPPTPQGIAGIPLTPIMV